MKLWPNWPPCRIKVHNTNKLFCPVPVPEDPYIIALNTVKLVTDDLTHTPSLNLFYTTNMETMSLDWKQINLVRIN